LGTSFGITTSYLAAAGAESIVSFEGSPAIAAIAKKQFIAANLQNIKLLLGNMDDTIPSFIRDAPPQDLFFLDGNHRKEPTLFYFEQLLTVAKPNSIFIVDDIHWSEGMEEAWEELKNNKAVTLSLDLFFIGILFVDPSFLVKQSFTIRF
jgi:predicted O-methyltransferase YrrM